jgi:hypothetical protein
LESTNGLDPLNHLNVRAFPSTLAVYCGKRAVLTNVGSCSVIRTPPRKTDCVWSCPASHSRKRSTSVYASSPAM